MSFLSNEVIIEWLKQPEIEFLLNTSKFDELISS